MLIKKVYLMFIKVGESVYGDFSLTMLAGVLSLAYSVHKAEMAVVVMVKEDPAAEFSIFRSW